MLFKFCRSVISLAHTHSHTHARRGREREREDAHPKAIHFDTAVHQHTSSSFLPECVWNVVSMWRCQGHSLHPLYQAIITMATEHTPLLPLHLLRFVFFSLPVLLRGSGGEWVCVCVCVSPTSWSFLVRPWTDIHMKLSLTHCPLLLSRLLCSDCGYHGARLLSFYLCVISLSSNRFSYFIHSFRSFRLFLDLVGYIIFFFLFLTS